MSINTNDLKKEGAGNEPAPKIEVKKQLTPSEVFLSECNEQEAAIFNEIKSILIENCDKYEFEAVKEDNLEDFSEIITYIKNGIIKLESDGVVVSLRKPLVVDGKELTKSIKILYERNEAREKTFTAGIKVSKKSIESQKDFTLATLAASFASVDGKMISVDSTRTIQSKNHRDYMLLLTCFNFFRN
jgi:hypothetical protein